MQYVIHCLVFLSTVSVAVLFEVKKVYVIERDFKTGQLRARRQNVPVQSHTMARIGALDHHQQQQQQQQLFNVAVSPPPLPSLPTTVVGGQQQQQQPLDLASTVDLTADQRPPIDYLTPPPHTDFHTFLPSSGTVESMVRAESHQFHQNVATAQAPPPPPLSPLTAASSTVHTSPFTPSGGGGGGGGVFPPAQAQPPPQSLGSLTVQTSSPSNQVNSLTFTSPPLEHFTPYTPMLVQESANHHHQQQQQQQVQPQPVQNGGRWELGFDASDILTPPFTSASELPSASGNGQTFFPQDFGQETAGSVRNNKQYPAGGGFFGGGGTGSFGGSSFGGGSNSNSFGSNSFGSFDTTVAANNKFTPLDAVIRSSPSNKNIYWGTPKSAQQQPLRPPPSFPETNAYRFNTNNNINNNNNNYNHNQFLDSYQMPFTGQFDGPLSQGTVADHVVHTSFRIKRQLRDSESAALWKTEEDDDHDHSDGVRKPVFSFVKTDRNGNFKWSVRHGY